MGMNLLCDILFCLGVMVLNIFSCLQKLLHFTQKYKQKAIKLLRQMSFAMGEFCICLSKILNQVKICNRFVHFKFCEQNFNCLYFEYFQAEIDKIFARIINSISKKSYNLQLKRVKIEIIKILFTEPVNPRYIFTLKNLSILFIENNNNLKLCLNNLKNWFCKTTEYISAFVPNSAYAILPPCFIFQFVGNSTIYYL